MGVTIHFEGRLKNEASLEQVIGAARTFAEREGWRHEPINETATTLERVRDEEDWDYHGPTSGIAVYPHENAEPLRLEFDRDLFVQEYIKTQYAPAQIHVKVVDLLKEIAPAFAEFAVVDEGEYWDTEKPEVLVRHLQNCFRVLDDELSARPELQGPVRLPSGRIVDLITR